MAENYFVGIDLGAGSGAKLGIFSKDLELIAKDNLPIYNIETEKKLVEDLYEKINKLMPDLKKINSVGLASPGIFTNKGKYIVAANLDFLNNKNLRQSLEDRLNMPVSIENDANAGGLAEWNESKEELFYWALGGGWGGAWISEKGDVKHSAVDWSGDDKDLHLTNEPGYATFLTKDEIKNVFNSYDADYKKLEIDISKKIRAEKIISGPGMSKIYKAISGKDTRPSKIDIFAEKGDCKAKTTYAIFGSLLSTAGKKIIERYNKENLPIYLGGKPSHAFPYFGWVANMGFKRYGCHLKHSKIFEKGKNPNLIGAAILAKRENGRRKN